MGCPLSGEWGEEGVEQKWDVIERRRVMVVSVLNVQSLFFLLKKIGFAPWSDIMQSQTLIFYWQEIFLLTLVSQWSHPLAIPLHCLWTKLNNRTRCQFECDVTWFCFCFDFVCTHARCGCCSKVCWREWGREGFILLTKTLIYV